MNLNIGDKQPLGKLAVLIAISGEAQQKNLFKLCKKNNYSVCVGKVGTMNPEKVISAVMTTAKREGLWEGSFAEEHALYDAILEALNGICRGQLALGDILRTVGLNFTVLRGEMGQKNKEWFAVALYGTIGAPIKGYEHETIGLGINHI